jgi:hypothetical protein
VKGQAYVLCLLMVTETGMVRAKLGDPSLDHLGPMQRSLTREISASKRPGRLVSTRIFFMRFLHCRLMDLTDVPSSKVPWCPLDLHPWIESIAQPIAKKVEAQYHDYDGDGWHKQSMGCRQQVVARF